MFVARCPKDGEVGARFTRTDGFTFIEIIIAITIIGILSTLGFMGIRGYIAKAKMLKTETNLKATMGLINEYYDDTGAYPSTLRDLVVRPTEPKIASRWKGYADEKEFISGCFLDGWKHDLVYQYTPGTQGQGRPFQLYSWGPKGEGAPQEEWIDAWNL